MTFSYAKTKTQISFAVTAKLISVFIFATRIVQYFNFLNSKFQAYSHFLWLHSPVCVGPGRKPRSPVFSQRGSNDSFEKKHDEGLGNNIENYTATSGVNAEDIEINAYITYEHRNIFKEFDYRLTLTAEEQRSIVLSNRSKIFLPQRKQMPITEKEIAQYEHLDLLGLVSMFYYEMIPLIQGHARDSYLKSAIKIRS